MSKTLVIIFLISITLTLADDPQPKCPKYSCNSTKADFCESSVYDTTNLFSQVVVGKACEKQSFCIQKENKDQVLDKHNDLYLNSKDNINLSCGTYTTQPGKNNRWPGESCTEQSDCYLQSSKCENNKCTGIAKDGKCSESSECLVGHFCSADKVCTEQLGIEQECKSTEQCINSAICNFGKCTKYYSVKVGEKVKATEDDNDFKLCELAWAVASEGSVYCMKIKYDRPETDSSEFKKCNLGDDCKYQAIGVENVAPIGLTLGKCQCGYNAEGNSYCKRYHDGSKKF